MPKITQLNQIDISPEKFLKACSQQELIELDMLLSSPHYQALINQVENGEITMMQLPNH